MIQHNYPTLYRGSVKDVLGPMKVGGTDAVIFQYTDSYSVFDWGRMPDALKRKGEALTVIASDLFERLEKPETWKEFSRSQEALALRRGNRFGAVFNEIGEELQAKGLRTHHLGVLGSGDGAAVVKSTALSAPPRHLVAKQVNVVRPAISSVLGRSLPDYYPTRNAPLPRLIPLEVVFRFSCPEGSSLLARAARDPGYMASIGFPGAFSGEVSAAQKWEFPIIELFTKLESTDRPVGLSEALAISGLSALQLQQVLLTTAWVAGALKWLCGKSVLELADGKLEWGLDEKGQCILVDAIGPDELRLLFRPMAGEPIQLSKEFLRTFYRATPWYEMLERAKEQAKSKGVSEWKKFVPEPPPHLPARHLELATQLYLALANSLTERAWFADAWPLDRVVAGLVGVSERKP